MRDRATIKKVLRFIRPHGGLVALMLLLAAVTVASTLYAPILIGKAVDQIVGPGQIYVLKLSRILVQLGVVIAVTAVAQWLMNLLTNQWATSDLWCAGFVFFIHHESLYALCKWSGVRGCRHLWGIYSDSTGDDGRTAYQFPQLCESVHETI